MQTWLSYFAAVKTTKMNVRCLLSFNKMWIAKFSKVDHVSKIEHTYLIYDYELYS